jgi:predicted metal-binding protein
MPKRALQTLPPPVERALIFICQKCGKRAGGSLKEASFELASSLKRAAKEEFSKKDVRIVLTGCMKICPEGGIATCVQLMQPQLSSAFLEADVQDVDRASKAVMERIRGG